MTNARTALTPLDHLVSEMIAFPFTSVAGLHDPVDQLDGRMSEGSARLWREAERYFVAHFPHIALDELISVRNWTWFGTDHQIEPLHAYVRRASNSWLRRRGPVAEPRLPDGMENDDNCDAAARRAWRWLTFAMPGDLLLAGLSQDGSGPVRCELITPFLARMLQEKGFAETHLHMGAGLDFPSAWASAVNVVARSPDQYPGMNYDAFHSPGADHEEGESLANWLVRAAIVRYLLGAYVSWGYTSGTFQSFSQGEFRKQTELSSDQHGVVATAIANLNSGRLTLPARDTRSAALEASFLDMQSTYNALTQASVIALPERLDDVQSLDPLSAFFDSHGFSGPTVQIQFLWKGLAYLERTGQGDFARLFWQVERVRCQVYRHCIQRPMTPGLMNFIRVYERKGAITGALEKVEFESCGVLSGAGRGLRSLEVRTQPSGNKNDQIGAFTAWTEKIEALRQQPEWREVECGIALHFLKLRGSKNDRGTPLAYDACNNADPDLPANTMQRRWQDFRQRQSIRADALAEAIEQQPAWLNLLRAIDVCRDEHGVPTWVTAPLFRRVRECVERARARHFADYAVELPELRTTAHVGEDFVHLATGLRYMDEAIEHLPLQVGDRVGHGLALGIDPDEWSRRQHRQLMPREDRWFDLVWERTWHDRQNARFSSNRTTHIEAEIVRIAQEIFGTEVGFNWTSTKAVAFCRLLYNGRLEELGFPGRTVELPDLPATDLDQQLERFVTSPAVYKRCRQVIWVEVMRDGEAVAELQRLVRNRYAETGITIEVNPISNLMVGDLTDLTSHPLWRLAPGLDHEFGATLRMCVGSDDPLPFATNLPEEYQFLYDSLLLAGKSHAAARKWIDGIRELGLESRFTIPVLDRG